MKYKIDTFEEFLQDKFSDRAPQVLDDDLPDAFDNWLGELDGEQYITFAEQYGKYVRYETLSNIGDMVTTETLKAHDELKK